MISAAKVSIFHDIQAKFLQTFCHVYQQYFCHFVHNQQMAHHLKGMRTYKLLKFKYYDTCKKKSELVAIHLQRFV